MQKDIFLGREDLKEKISHQILTSRSMPMFLIQGQRRVGKTSLLKFLPLLLDEKRFKVIYQDLQDKGLYSSIPEWLYELRLQANRLLGVGERGKTYILNDWLEAWQKTRLFLEEISSKNDFKIILAFDEYEQIHKMIAASPEKGADLLSAMRSFSQHQDKVVFMFIGAALFSELKQPNWSKYFVQAIRFKVNYLNKRDSIQLITKPNEDFKLKFETGVPEKIFEETQGHPHLLQFICSEMVDFANQNNTEIISMENYRKIIQYNVLNKEAQPFSVFWTEFCENPKMKSTVIKISNQKLQLNSGEVFRLLEHEYINEFKGQYKMRVPLFAQWIRKFGHIE